MTRYDFAMGERRPGRPREYPSDADRVRAWRAKQKEKTTTAAPATAEAPADPAEPAATLAAARERAEELRADLADARSRA